MKILFLCSNPRVEASMRFRLLQFVEPLRAAGHEVTVSTFFETQPRAYPTRIALGAARRLVDLVRARRVDRIVVHREIFPLGMNQLVRLLPKKVPLIFDFDDAVFQNIDKGWRSHVAQRDSTKLLVERASAVYAGNEFLAEYARQFSKHVTIVPTVVDTDHFAPLPSRPASSKPIVGWVGSPSAARYLELVLPSLELVAKTHPFRLRLVGAGREYAVPGIEVENLAWREDEEVRAFQQLDVGLYPLLDDAWSRGKCGFKAIQYMACGVPFAVNPVGVIQDIVRDGIDGLWVKQPSDWAGHLTSLLSDSALRVRLTTHARERAVERYSVKSLAPEWIRGIEQAH